MSSVHRLQPVGICSHDLLQLLEAWTDRPESGTGGMLSPPSPSAPHTISTVLPVLCVQVLIHSHNASLPFVATSSMSARVGYVFKSTLAYSPSSVPAQSTALLLLDYQNITVPRLGDAGTRTVEVAQEMRKWAAFHHVSIFHCIVDANDKPTASSRMSERWSSYEAMIKQHPELGREVPELEPTPTERTEAVFTRRPGVVSALSSPGIAEALQEKGIHSLLLGGLSTSGCLLSTARAATDQGYITTVVEDACCDPVPGLHDMLVKHVLPMSAHVAKSEEVMNMWADAA